MPTTRLTTEPQLTEKTNRLFPLTREIQRLPSPRQWMWRANPTLRRRNQQERQFPARWHRITQKNPSCLGRSMTNAQRTEGVNHKDRQTSATSTRPTAIIPHTSRKTGRNVTIIRSGTGKRSSVPIGWKTHPNRQIVPLMTKPETTANRRQQLKGEGTASLNRFKAGTARVTAETPLERAANHTDRKQPTCQHHRSANLLVLTTDHTRDMKSRTKIMTSPVCIPKGNVLLQARGKTVPSRNLDTLSGQRAIRRRARH